jgi:hypothetical protein
MAHVKDVEAAVGENDFLTLPLQDTQDFFQLIWGFDLFTGHDPIREKGEKGNQRLDSPASWLFADPSSDKKFVSI